MPIHRAEHKDNFTQILNNLLSDNRLSYGARGVMAYALTHYDNWVFNGENYFVTDKDKISKVKKYLNELIEYGYLKRYQEKSNKGIFGNIIYIFNESPLFEKLISDLPITEKLITDEIKEKSEIQPTVNLPLTDLPLTVPPLAENLILNNTNITNTNNYIYTSIFDYWNSKGIVRHKEINSNIKKAIDKALKIKVEGEVIKENDIKKAIDNYKDVLESEHFFNHKWSLAEFLTRKQKDTGINQLVLFLDNGTTYENYKQWAKRKNNNSKNEDWRF